MTDACVQAEEPRAGYKSPGYARFSVRLSLPLLCAKLHREAVLLKTAFVQGAARRGGNGAFSWPAFI